MPEQAAEVLSVDAGTGFAVLVDIFMLFIIIFLFVLFELYYTAHILGYLYFRFFFLGLGILLQCSIDRTIPPILDLYPFRHELG